MPAYHGNLKHIVHPKDYIALWNPGHRHTAVAPRYARRCPYHKWVYRELDSYYKVDLITTGIVETKESKFALRQASNF